MAGSSRCYESMTPSDALLRRYRLVLGCFLVGLIVSGITAFPLLAELRLLADWLGVVSPERYADYHGLRRWIGFVLLGLEQTHARFPFLAYGTDWLAFGHLAIAVFLSAHFFVHSKVTGC